MVSSSDGCDSSISGQDNNWSSITFKRSVQEWKALQVKHMRLIDEKDTWDNLCLTFLPPLWDLCVDLISDFWFYLSCLPRKEDLESLCTGVDDIDFMKSYCMNNFLSLLKLPFGALYHPSLGPHSIIISSSWERPTQLWNLSTSLVNGNHISSWNLFFWKCFYHLLAQIINSLHFCCF